MKNLLRVTTLLLCAGCASAAHAGNIVDVSVRDRDTGEQLKVYRHHGKLYVAGRPGSKYAVSLHNKSGGRALTVLSVDGVNAISGETAALHQSGYVLDAYTGTEVTGWRKSMSEVAAFVFTALPNSYAARTGRPENVGVIGVAVFREVVPPRPEALMEPSHESESAPSGASADMARAAPKAKLGTGHGQRETSHVEYTEFRRATEQPTELIKIYYDSHANLVARGVITVQPVRAPDPFPGKFAPDPWG